MNILVTGATGYIGPFLIKRLKKEGYYVKGVDLKKPEFSNTDADDFIIGDTSSDYGNQIQIRLYKQNLMIEDAHIYFNDDVTAGLDPGRDAGDLNQSAGLMSRLVENDQGVGFAIQELPTEIMNNCIIPLEVNTYANEEFKINLHVSTLEWIALP